MFPFRRTLLERFERVVGIFAVQRFQVGGRNRLLHSRAARCRIREEAQGLKRLTGDAIYSGVDVVPHHIVGGDVVGPASCRSNRLARRSPPFSWIVRKRQ